MSQLLQQDWSKERLMTFPLVPNDEICARVITIMEIGARKLMKISVRIIAEIKMERKTIKTYIAYSCNRVLLHTKHLISKAVKHSVSRRLMPPAITFDESATDAILDEFNKAVDEEGYIIEADTGERVLTPEGEEITKEEFAGIAKGSEIFVEDNFVSLINHVKRRQ